MKKVLFEHWIEILYIITFIVWCIRILFGIYKKYLYGGNLLYKVKRIDFNFTTLIFFASLVIIDTIRNLICFSVERDTPKSMILYLMIIAIYYIFSRTELFENGIFIKDTYINYEDIKSCSLNLKNENEINVVTEKCINGGNSYSFVVNSEERILVYKLINKKINK